MPGPDVLIVDDADDYRHLLAELLRAWGYTVDGVGDGGAAVAALAARDAWPRVILLDWEMPYMHGEEFVDWLRARPDLAASVALVVFSSFTLALPGTPTVLKTDLPALRRALARALPRPR